MAEGVVRETAWGRLAHWIGGLFSERIRYATAEELSLRAQLDIARQERDEARVRVRELDLIRAEQEAQLKVNKVTVDNMALENTRLRTALEADIAIENRRIAEATMATARLHPGAQGVA